LCECWNEIVDVDNAYDALKLDAPPQPQTHVGDYAEKSIAADRQAEELGILASAAGGEAAVGVHQREGFNIANDRLKREAAAVDVGAEGAAERQPVSAGLLLNDAPGRKLAPLHGDEALDQLRPLDARLGFDDALLEPDDPPHGSHIKKDGIL